VEAPTGGLLSSLYDSLELEAGVDGWTIERCDQAAFDKGDIAVMETPSALIAHILVNPSPFPPPPSSEFMTHPASRCWAE
jgi:hypothetical protein